MSTRDVTKACTRVFIDSASSDRRTLFSWRNQKKHLEQTVSTCYSILSVVGERVQIRIVLRGDVSKVRRVEYE